MCVTPLRTLPRRIAKLLRVKTSKSNGKLVSLDEYIEGMKKGQKFIYFLSGDSDEVSMGSYGHVDAVIVGGGVGRSAGGACRPHISFHVTPMPLPPPRASLGMYRRSARLR